ncbi:hypothetical protein ACLOJK_030754 [Asimina triloba]
MGCSPVDGGKLGRCCRCLAVDGLPGRWQLLEKGKNGRRLLNRNGEDGFLMEAVKTKEMRLGGAPVAVHTARRRTVRWVSTHPDLLLEDDGSGERGVGEAERLLAERMEKKGQRSLVERGGRLGRCSLVGVDGQILLVGVDSEIKHGRDGDLLDVRLDRASCAGSGISSWWLSFLMAWIGHPHPRRSSHRRQPWLPVLREKMEHRVWCSGGALKTVYMQ